MKLYFQFLNGVLRAVIYELGGDMDGGHPLFYEAFLLRRYTLSY